MTILKESNNNNNLSALKEEQAAPAKKSGVTLSDYVVELQDRMAKINEHTEETDWNEKYQKLLDILKEKNIVNFMVGVDICMTFIAKALQYRRKFVEVNLIEIFQPILNK